MRQTARKSKVKKVITYKKIGRGLRELRGDQTLKELAVIMNLTASHICEMENQRRIPSINVIDRYARRLDVEIDLVFSQDSD